MLTGLLLALSTMLLPQVSARQNVSPLVPAQHFRSVTVPFEYFNRHIFITLTLNGRPGMVFMLDTGTSSNVLDLHASEVLGLKPVSIQQQKGVGLGSGKVNIAADKDIDARIGDIQVANWMAVVDLSGLQNHFSHREDGILGFPFLQNFVVILDFDKRELTLLPSKRYSYRGSGDTLSLLGKSESTLIPVMLGTVGQPQRRANLEIDTGSDVTLLLYSHYVQGAHMEGAFLARPIQAAYGLGGYFLIQLGLLQSLLMGRIQASNLAIFQLQSDPVFVARKNCVGVIGTSLLDQFQKIIFDVPGGHVILELKPTDQISANRPAFPMLPTSPH